MMVTPQHGSQPPRAAPAAPAPVDRRTGGRQSTVLLVGKACRDGHVSVCLVHDISRYGMMARFTAQPRIGETLCIEVRGLPPIEGVVRWVRGVKAGFEFAAPRPVDQVFRLKDDEGIVARSPRFAISATARLRVAGRAFDADLLDISPGGVKLASDIPVVPGETGQILFPDTDTALFGTICWSREDRFGFRFVRPLPLQTLSMILGC